MPVSRGLSAAAWAVFSALALFGACKKAEEDAIVLAQVEQSRLTLEDLRESFPPEYEKILTREQYLDFIQRWIDDEAAYQHALKRKIDQDPKVVRRLESMRRKVVVEELLARDGAGADYEPDEGAMARYYEMHSEEFRRATPEFRFASLRASSLKEALALRAKAKNEDFLALAARHSGDSGAEMAGAVPFRKPSEIPPCLFEAMADAKSGFLSQPVNCPDGIYVFKLLERVEAGTAIPFAEARGAISGRLAMEHKDRMRGSKIRQYKEALAVSFDISRIPGLESQPEAPPPQAAAAMEPEPDPPPPPRPKPRRRAVPAKAESEAPAAEAARAAPGPATETKEHETASP